MQIYLSQSFDPFYNLAVENWLLREVLNDKPILYLWQNNPSVIIGRAQNPWRECNLIAMHQDGIPMVRRQSGGGTVYHDKGNLNYTLFSKSSEFDKKKNLTLIIETLKTAGIHSFASERNDILITHQGNDYKISGSAFRQTKDHCFHHGTLLINANTKKLYDYLHHDIDPGLSSKGVASHRSNVINLSDIYPDITIDSIKTAFLNRFRHDIAYLPHDLNCPLIQQEMETLKTWSWRFGKTLPFYQRFDDDNTPLILHISEGRVIDIETSLSIPALKEWIFDHTPIYCRRSFADIHDHFSQLERRIIVYLNKQITDVLSL
ncbi:MAG: lipoate--protein ligase [Francisellaceae bacterium]